MKSHRCHPSIDGKVARVDPCRDHPLPGRPTQPRGNLLAAVELPLRLAVDRPLVGAGQLLVEEEGGRQAQARHETPGQVADDLDVVGRGARGVDLLQFVALGHGRDVARHQVGDREPALLLVGFGGGSSSVRGFPAPVPAGYPTGFPRAAPLGWRGSGRSRASTGPSESP